ncbi:4Fe-4S dicluster domain-containing protein [Slackia heliotrinireducens]|uniref:Fe-S-cluster-containing hydrogenase subunit n=1 Tax=Slackia heliotrinireducens (strain ATCC 29202 / DSM 20476 / NCTC 11029 / RHS 1) TaxID=471855 RepID=C7N3K1_SLAHD|nr:4Fe-4S dicluster domain-containing protein [Slackia heliotrinireducens]ACV23724.1 Fe-S-cluster-containing hydrogenase subunit [Slackia heliotrinireducens DSM 20476]VEH03315.1 DMSO reductase iron-sulfur subunit [Slackia heliotrinireducens]
MSLGFYVDMTQCIGCRTCQVACKDRMNLQSAGPRCRRVDTFECGEYPEVGMFTSVISCNHCENPACVANCPVGAMYKDPETGLVLHDDNLCIKCETCMRSCPYGAPQHDMVEDLIIKCDTCKDLRAAGMQPTCVAACPMRALDFGEMDDLRAKYGDDLVSELPFLPTADTTTPNLLIKPSESAKSETFNPVVM